MTPARVTLRPVHVDDLDLVVDPSDDSTFDDVGPKAAPGAVPPCRLDADGVFAVDADGAFAGTIGWHWIRWGSTIPSRSPIIGMRLLERARGRGVGTAALRHLTALFLRHTTVNRIEANTDAENVAAQRILEKAGFTREGVLRGALWRDGAHRDSALYSILRSEWTPPS